MILQKYSFRDRLGVTHRRRVVEEFFQYGKRFYNTMDLDTGETVPAVADDVDKMFATPPAQQKKKGFKGGPIRTKRVIQ